MSKPKLTAKDYCDAAADLRCNVAAVQAVADVESAGHGFDNEDKIIIRFEGHKFREFTSRRFDIAHPEISYPYAQQKSKRHGREAFNIAFALDPNAALLSTSWGKFQVMGFTHDECGYSDVSDFVDYLQLGEREQLLAFISLVKHRKLDVALRQLNWAHFAEHYNGADYRDHNYDGKLLDAYKQNLRFPVNCSQEKSETQATQPIPISLSVHFDEQKLINEIIKKTDSLGDAGATLSSHEDKTADDTDGQKLSPENAAVSTNSSPVEPANIAPTKVVTVPQVSAEKDQPKAVPGLKAHWAAIVAFLTANGAAIWQALSGAKPEIIIGLFIAAAVIGTVYVVTRYQYVNKEKNRDFELTKLREAQAHELMKINLANAANPNFLTTQITPTPITNSEIVAAV